MRKVQETRFSMIEDKLLIWKFNRGNKEALRRIYEKYKDDLVTLAATLLIDVAFAEDTVHDVFVSFVNSARKFRLTGSLKAYLATCVANNARNKNKAGKRYGSIGLDQAGQVASDSNRPEFAAIFGEQSRRIIWALAQIPYEQREVLILHTCTGMKFKAIAARQNVSINTVQGRYRYAVDKMRSLLNNEVEK